MLTQRLGSGTQKNPEFIDKLVNVIKNNPGSCDEVWFATDYGFPPLDVHRNTAEIIKNQARKFRDIGVRVSLQVSNSIGHGEYMKSTNCSGLVFEGSEVEHMVGPDGTVAGYCFCWNGENFREFVKQEMRIYAEIHPHTVWFDDDLRPVNHNPVDKGCFCDSCIAKFNKKYGTSFDRKGLVDAVSYGDLKYREMFVEFQRSNLYDFAYQMSKTICEISPETYMGYQYYCNGGFTGFNFDYIFDGFRDGSGKNPKCRPGGGCYDAHNPNDVLGKSMQIDFQNVITPPYVTDIRPEIENLPDVVYGKSISSTCFETTVNLARGANAMSYAMIMNDYESFDWHNDMFAAFSENRKYWEKLSELSSETKASGVPLFHSKNMWRRKLEKDAALLSYAKEPVFNHDFLMITGIPVTHFQKDDVSILYGEMAEVITDEDIENLLKRNILADGYAVSVLNRRGFGDKLGVGAEKIESRAFRIVYDENKANTVCPGKRWKKSLCDGESDYRLVPLGNKVSVLSHYDTDALDVVPQDGEYPFGIADAVTETTCGGKWAIIGYEPWSNIICMDRRNYLISLLDYLGNSVSAYVESRLQSVVMPREKYGKVLSVSVINCELYSGRKIKVRIRNPYGTQPKYIDRYNEYLPAFTMDGNEMTVEIDSIEGWNVGTIYFDI